MKIALSWLGDYVKTSLSPDKLAERLILATAEVEEVLSYNSDLDKIVIGLVKEVTNHPQSEKLHLAKVDIGTAKLLNIVCGAQNLAAGQTVIVATLGAKLKNIKGENLTIEKVKIRGELSEGMICATSELSLPIDDNGGIFVLDKSYAPGTPAFKALGLDSSVLDLTITVNRPDLLSYLGIAREVATLEHKPLNDPPILSLERNNQSLPKLVDLELQPGVGCERISALCLDILKLGPSPWWMQARLIQSGMRPINAVVDVTNYVMLEMGQPLHAYDYNLISSSSNHASIQVGTAKDSSRFTGLDEKTRSTEMGDLLILDSKGNILSLAGIMGGMESRVSDHTTRIVLESASFNPHQIRKTSRRIGLRTESSSRFEKGMDPENTVPALKRAAFLLQEMGVAIPASKLSDLKAHDRADRPKLNISINRIQDIVGVHISIPEAKANLQKLGFQIQNLTKAGLVCIPPTWRQDVKIEEDVYEELVRIWGYDRLPLNLPAAAVYPPRPNPAYTLGKSVRKRAVVLGFNETLHGSFTNVNYLNRINLDGSNAIPLSSLYSQDETHLIPNHLINFLRNIADFQNETPTSKLFEIGHVFLPPNQENYIASFVLRSNQTPTDYYRQGKSLLEYWCLDYLGNAKQNLNYALSSDPKPYFIPETAFTLKYFDHTLGEIGLLKPEVIQAYKIRSGRNIIFGELSLDKLLEQTAKGQIYQPFSEFPTITRDLTIVVPVHLNWEKIHKALQDRKPEAIEQSWSLEAVYSGKPLPDGQRSLTIRTVYQAKDRTLTDHEVEKAQASLESHLKSKLDLNL